MVLSETLYTQAKGIPYPCVLVIHCSDTWIGLCGIQDWWDMSNVYRMRETKRDIQIKSRMMDDLTGYLNSRYAPHHFYYENLYEPKYKIDCALLTKGSVISFVECKTSNHDQLVYVNSAKIQRGVSLAKSNNVRFSLVAHKNKTGETFVISIANGGEVTHKHKPIWMKDGRVGHDNGDDSEPVIAFRWNEMTLISEVKQ